MKICSLIWLMIGQIRSDPSMSCGPVKDGFIKSTTRSKTDFHTSTGIRVTVLDSARVQEINVSGGYVGLQITAVSRSTDQTVGTFRIGSGGASGKKWRLLKCQSPRDSVRHTSDRMKKLGVSRFFWSGQCTDDVVFKVYIAKGNSDSMFATSSSKLDWDLLNLDCGAAIDDNEVSMTVVDESMLASRSASFNGQRAKLVGEIINLKSVPQKSPRRFVPKTTGPQWSEWSEWSECKGSCDQAVKNSRSRDRKCVLKGKTVQDSECYKKGSGQSIELEDCQRQCAEWTEWGSWSSCTKSCGSGYRYKQRYCLHGFTCEGPPDLRERCNTEPCHKADVCIDKYTFCPKWKDQGYCETEYKSWMSENCSKACGKCTKSTDTCKDEYDVSCTRWQLQGKCDTDAEQVRSFVREQCKKSCKLC